MVGIDIITALEEKNLPQKQKLGKMGIKKLRALKNYTIELFGEAKKERCEAVKVEMQRRCVELRSSLRWRRKTSPRNNNWDRLGANKTSCTEELHGVSREHLLKLETALNKERKTKRKKFEP